MASAPSVTAFFGLLVSMYATGFFPYVDLQSGGESCFVRAPPLDAAVHTMLLAAAAAMVAFHTSVALIYARIGGGAVDRMIRPQVVYLILFLSSGVLHVFLAPQPGAIDGGQDLLPLAVAVVHVLRPAAAATTFFLSMTLIYTHVRAVGRGEGGAGAAATAAGNVPIATTTVELLAKLVLAAALVTVVLTLTSTVLAASYAD
ncbi:hypothetical protein OsI_22067 [Oryza sativa Indica Group]|uniref:Uncharacterized protein n=1 Tax=Oryza sativa subsp. indica TaxID=39946 RepID=A2YAF1_ORYSI|nr:hypothetical protein OsI_22067 [Oryza sativa Indica Group]